MENQVIFNDELISPCLLTMQDIETELELPNGFTKSFIKLDDWTFMVKGWAYVESILELLVWSKIDHMPLEFRKVISKVDSGNMKTGKLAFAKALELLGPREWKYLQSFVEFRNLVAHGIGNIQFDFIGFISSQEDKTKKEFFKKFESCNCCGIQEFLFKNSKELEQLSQHPREYVMAGYYDVLHCLSVGLENKGFREIRASIIKGYNQHVSDWYTKFNEEFFKNYKKNSE
jgi:hypothetical protein